MHFDPQIWRDRAWKHLKKSHIAGKPKQKVEAEWVLDTIAISDLTKVVEWCSERGLKIDFVKKPAASYYPDSKAIQIAHRLKPIRQLIYLLHECGHHLIGSSEDHERYGMGYPQNELSVKRTFHHRLTCLDEEFEAWHRGWKLAQRLKLNITRDKYDQLKVECLRTYVKWALRPGKIVEQEEEKNE